MGPVEKWFFPGFEALNNEKIERDKLADWWQVKYVATFNEDYHLQLLDLTPISVDK